MQKIGKLMSPLIDTQKQTCHNVLQTNACDYYGYNWETWDPLLGKVIITYISNILIGIKSIFNVHDSHRQATIYNNVILYI